MTNINTQWIPGPSTCGRWCVCAWPPKCTNTEGSAAPVTGDTYTQRPGYYSWYVILSTLYTLLATPQGHKVLKLAQLLVWSDSTIKTCWISSSSLSTTFLLERIAHCEKGWIQNARGLRGCGREPSDHCIVSSQSSTVINFQSGWWSHNRIWSISNHLQSRHTQGTLWSSTIINYDIWWCWKNCNCDGINFGNKSHEEYYML